MNYIDKENGPVKFLSRAERRKMLKGLVKQPKTAEEMCDKTKISLKLGKKIDNALKSNWELTEMDKDAERNSQMLKHFVETFGDEKGKEMYNKNLELKK